MNVLNPVMYQMFVCLKMLFAGLFNFFVCFKQQLSLSHVAAAHVKTACSGTVNWLIQFSIQRHSNKRLVVDLIPCSFSWWVEGPGKCFPSRSHTFTGLSLPSSLIKPSSHEPLRHVDQGSRFHEESLLRPRGFSRVGILSEAPSHPYLGTTPWLLRVMRVAALYTLGRTACIDQCGKMPLVSSK